MPPRGKKATSAKAAAAKKAAAAAEVSTEPISVQILGLTGSWQDEELKEKLHNVAGKESTEYRVNESRTEAIVTFADSETADKVIEELNGKPLDDSTEAGNLTLKIFDANASLPTQETPSSAPAAETTPAAASSSAMDEDAASDAKEKREAERKANEKTTVAEPPITYLFRAKDLVEHIRKRRGYDLDSSAMARRAPGRGKRRHSEMKGDEGEATTEPAAVAAAE